MLCVEILSPFKSSRHNIGGNSKGRGKGMRTHQTVFVLFTQ